MLQRKESLPDEFLYFIPCNTAESGRKKMLNEPREVFQSRSRQERQCRTACSLVCHESSIQLTVCWHTSLAPWEDSQPGNCLNSLYLTTKVKCWKLEPSHPKLFCGFWKNNMLFLRPWVSGSPGRGAPLNPSEGWPHTWLRTPVTVLKLGDMTAGQKACENELQD